MYRKAVQYSTKGQQNKLQNGKDPESAGNSAETADPEDTSLLEGVVGNVAGQLGSLRKRDGSLSPRQDIGKVLTKSRIGLARSLPQQQHHNETESTNSTSSSSGTSQQRSASVKNTHNVWVTPQNSTQSKFDFPLANFATKTNPQDVTFNGIMFGEYLRPASMTRMIVGTDDHVLASYLPDTFFGGSDPSWATPRDQQSYFNSLGLKINAWQG